MVLQQKDWSVKVITGADWCERGKSANIIHLSHINAVHKVEPKLIQPST